jgi:hypothetical protein
LTSAERNYSYSQLPPSKLISLPKYNVSDFKKGLVWRQDNERERNEYITYPVPYLGNYKLDGTENSGSHSGIDIKIPIGTPVHSISRGVVTKAENQPTGFGKYIVIMHKNVPGPQNPAKKTTLFSVYAHLSQIKVKVGEHIAKGQIIGLSGSSGMSTAPHIHFQIDTADAPFHPYWPITWKDVVNNGLSSFFDAVKQGLNKNKAKKYTVNPMKLVANNINYVPTSSKLVATAGRTDKEISRNTTKPTTIKNKAIRIKRIPRRNNSRRKFRFKGASTPVSNNRIRIATRRRPTQNTNTLHASANKKTVTQKTASAKAVVLSNSNSAKKNINERKYGDNEMWIETSRSFVPRITKTVKLFIKNKELIPRKGISLRVESKDFVKIVPTTARLEAFEKGFLEVQLTATSNKPFKLIIDAKNHKSIESPSFLSQPFSDISAIGKERAAAQYVKTYKIMNGYSNGEFRPNDYLNRAEATKAIITSGKLKLIPTKNTFKDVKSTDWFSKYVSTALSYGLISGYEGNLFKPTKNITKAEFLKMALVSRKINLADKDKDPYRDVPANSWYEKYFTFARNNGLINSDSRGFVYPNRPISRIEAAQVLYKLFQLK